MKERGEAGYGVITRMEADRKAGGERYY